MKSREKIISHKVAVYGYWRTGTNLLISFINKNNNFFDFNEYFGNTIAHVKTMPGITEDQIKQYAISMNSYFRLMNDDYNVKNSLVKIMVPHTDFVEFKTEQMFNFRFLTYRSDFSKTVISKIVAESRKSWVNVDGQPEFNDVIDIEEYAMSLRSMIDVFWNYLNSGSYLNVDCIVNYENDLESYAKENITSMKRSENVTIKNQHEIDIVYDSYRSQIEDICEKLKLQSQKRMSLSDSIDYLNKQNSAGLNQ